MRGLRIESEKLPEEQFADLPPPPNKISGEIPEPSIGRPRDILTFVVVLFFISIISLFIFYFFTKLPHFPAKPSLAYGYLYLIIREGLFLILLYKYFKRFCTRRGITFRDRFGIDSGLNLRLKPFLYYSIIVLILLYADSGVGDFFGNRAANLSFDLSSYYSWWIIYAVVVGPIKEEFIYRGFMYPIFKSRYGVYRGMCITSIIFALTHIGWVTKFGWLHTSFLLPFWFLSGLFLNVIYEKEKHLLWNIIFHALGNFLPFVISLIAWIYVLKFSGLF